MTVTTKAQLLEFHEQATARMLMIEGYQVANKYSLRMFHHRHIFERVIHDYATILTASLDDADAHTNAMKAEALAFLTSVPKDMYVQSALENPKVKEVKQLCDYANLALSQWYFAEYQCLVAKRNTSGGVKDKPTKIELDATYKKMSDCILALPRHSAQSLEYWTILSVMQEKKGAYQDALFCVEKAYSILFLTGELTEAKSALFDRRCERLQQAHRQEQPEPADVTIAKLELITSDSIESLYGRATPVQGYQSPRGEERFRTISNGTPDLFSPPSASTVYAAPSLIARGMQFMGFDKSSPKNSNSKSVSFDMTAEVPTKKQELNKLT